MRIIHNVYQVANGSLSFDDLVTGQRGVTGSEQAMLYLALAQKEQGHNVTCYLPTDKTGYVQGVEMLDIRTAWPRLRRMDQTDIAISWLSSDALRGVSPHVLRIHSLQINDWLMNAPGYENYTDVFVAVSKSHKAHLMSMFGHPVDETKWEIIPNGVDNSRFTSTEERVPFRCVYLSSPDRGLHWALSMWPEIRFTFPKAELHVFYEVKAWKEAARGLYNEVGIRADFIRTVGQRLETNGGVMFRNAVSPKFLAQELSKADIMFYPCDTVRYTEGFGVAIMEACAAGVVPIITDADALGEVYAGSGAVVVPRGNDRRWADRYLEQVISMLGNRTELEERRGLVKAFAQKHDWSSVAKEWSAMIERRRK